MQVSRPIALRLRGTQSEEQVLVGKRFAFAGTAKLLDDPSLEFLVQTSFQRHKPMRPIAKRGKNYTDLESMEDQMTSTTAMKIPACRRDGRACRGGLAS